MSENSLPRLSTRAKTALIASQKLARQLGHFEIGPEHLLFGIAEISSSLATEAILKRKTTSENIRREVEKLHLPEETSAHAPKLSKSLQHILEKAAIAAHTYSYPFIGTEHLLYALVEQATTAGKILEISGLNPEDIKKDLKGMFEHFSRFPEIIQPEEEALEDEIGQVPRSKTAALDYFTIDLTKRAKTGKIDPLVGRQKEIGRVINILNRRTKNNPVLIGEPGVGKTAIVEGLALAITRSEVPDFLLDKKILYLDLAQVLAGSMFRGEFENRLKQIIEEVKTNPHLILFIDEMHTMIGAGATTGSLDAANILKPALARGEIKVIGATTLSDYKKHVETDPALERRFQPIVVEESTVAETKEILRGLKPFYEQYHQIIITDEALDAACELSERYLAERFLPDKAIDLLDESASVLRSLQGRSPGVRKLRKLKERITQLENEKNQAVLAQDFPKAAKLQVLLEGYKKIRQQMKAQLKKEASASRPQLTSEHVASTVAATTKIPLQKLLKRDRARLVNLEGELKRHIVGQDEVLKNIAQTIRRSRTGVASPTRPMGSFLFLGPTGVGKTETARVLAREVFGSEKDLIRLDMSEFMERHNVARLLGAPAGYVGYEEGGRLTEAVRRKPYAVILFDEVEKAHSEVFNILLQLLEDGELTDAAGKKVNFKNTIIILTSNIGNAEFNQYAMGFAEAVAGKQAGTALPDYEKLKENILQSLRERFSLELLNRIDHIAVFRPLDGSAIKQIIRLELKKLAERLASSGIKMSFDTKIVAYLCQKSSDPKEGARKIRKNIQDEIESLISEQLLENKINPPAQIKLVATGDKPPSLKIEII